MADYCRARSDGVVGRQAAGALTRKRTMRSYIAADSGRAGSSASSSDT